jgi:hypothetical protein
MREFSPKIWPVWEVAGSSPRRWSRWLGCLVGGWLAIGPIPTAVAQNLTPINTQRSTQNLTQNLTQSSADLGPLDLSLYEQGQCADRQAGVKHSTIDQARLTIPSLWWTQEQFVARSVYKDQLIEGWIACPGSGARPGRVDLLVNLQIWSLLTYLERYEFLNQFGPATSQAGYNLRIFNREAARSVCPAGYQPNLDAAGAGIGGPLAAPCVCQSLDQCPTTGENLVSQVAFERRLAAYSCDFAAISTQLSCQIEDTARQTGLKRDPTGGFSPTGPDNTRSPWR